MSQLERLQKARKEERGNTAILLLVAVTVELFNSFNSSFIQTSTSIASPIRIFH